MSDNKRKSYTAAEPANQLANRPAASAKGRPAAASKGRAAASSKEKLSASASMPWRSGELESPTDKEVQTKSRKELLAEKREERLKKALKEQRDASERRTRTAAYAGFIMCIPLTIVEYLTSGRLALGVWAICFCMSGTLLFLRRSTRLEKIVGEAFLVISAVLLILRIYLDMR